MTLLTQKIIRDNILTTAPSNPSDETCLQYREKFSEWKNKRDSSCGQQIRNGQA